MKHSSKTSSYQSSEPTDGIRHDWRLMRASGRQSSRSLMEWEMCTGSETIRNRMAITIPTIRTFRIVQCGRLKRQSLPLHEILLEAPWAIPKIHHTTTTFVNICMIMTKPIGITNLKTAKT